MSFALVLAVALCAVVVYIAFDEGLMSGELDRWDASYYGSVMAVTIAICLWILSIRSG